MKTYNLIGEQWLPIRRVSGRRDWIAPWQIVEGLDGGDPVAALASPRPDFDGALTEFLIGLLSTAAAPEDRFEWRERWRAPFTPEELKAKFETVAHAFNLDGDGPRAFQDREELNAPLKIAGLLLIDDVGMQGRERNADLFVHGDTAPKVMSRAAAAMALVTLQTYAPAGGKGNMTSLRGGGPLTTLLRMSRGGLAVESLWDLLWSNVETAKAIEERAVSLTRSIKHPIFPWLEKTRVSGAGGVQTTPNDAHPLQVYWGMPRRIRLAFEPGNGLVCPLTGLVDDMVVTGYRTRPYGTDYTGGWRHPLSPYYRAGKGKPELLPVHGQPGGLSYRHWLGLVLKTPDDLREPAQAITNAKAEGRIGQGGTHMVAFGYDMDNMKARGWIASEMPVWIESGETARRFEQTIEQVILATDLAARALRWKIMTGLFARPADAPGDHSHWADRLWQATEAAFLQSLLPAARAAIDADPEGEDPTLALRAAWLATLLSAACAIFDEAVSPAMMETGDMARPIKARFDLVMMLRGYGADGEALFKALALMPPDKAAKRGRTRKAEAA